MDTGRTKAGGYAVRFPGDDTYTEVTKDEYDAARAGVGGQIGRGLKNTLQDLGAGAVELLAPKSPWLGGDAIRERTTDWRTRNDREQEILRRTNPGLQIATEAAPDVAAGLLTRNPAVALGIDTAIGAARNPENPLLGMATAAAPIAIGTGINAGVRAGVNAMRPGTARGLEIGNSVVNNSRAARREISAAAREGRAVNPEAYGRTADPLEPGVPGGARGADAGAKVNPSPTYELSTKILGKTLDSDVMLDRYSFPTSEAQAKIIDTRSPNEFFAARHEDAQDFQKWRGGGGKLGQIRDVFSPRMNYDDLRATQMRSLNAEIMRAMGDPNSVAVTRSNVGKARRSISDSFNRIAKEAGALDPHETAILRTQLGMLIQAESDEGAQRALMSVLSDFDALAKPGAITAEDLLTLRNRVAKDVSTSYGRNPDLVVGNALRDAEDAIDQAFYKKLPPDAREDMANNRFQWGVANTALRTSAAANARGDVNIKSFINAYRQGNRRFKIGYDDSEFAKFLDTASAVLFKESSDSGTPQALGPLLADIAGAVGVPGAGLIGGFMR